MARTVADLSVEPIDRRGFLNRTMIAALGAFAAAFGAGSIAVLWPERRPGFGNRIVVGKLNDVLSDIRGSDGPVYHPEGKFYLVPYDTTDLDNPYVVAGAAAHGIMALYQKCPHLGCRTPYCGSSRLFECPCHSAAFNLAGERLAGPAPAGMWRFRVELDPQSNVVVDTRYPVSQPPRGTDTLGQRPAGAHCVRDIAITS